MQISKLKPDQEICYVEDNDEEISIIQFYYKMANLKNPLRIFTSGESFLEYMNNLKDTDVLPSLALVDIRMPNMNGFEVVEHLKKNSKFKNVPFILMFSNSDAPSDVKRAYASGADGYKTKPMGKKAFTEFLLSLVE